MSEEDPDKNVELEKEEEEEEEEEEGMEVQEQAGPPPEEAPETLSSSKQPQQWDKTEIPVVSWMRQFSFVGRKNWLLIVRRPILLVTMVRVGSFKVVL